LKELSSTPFTLHHSNKTADTKRTEPKAIIVGYAGVEGVGLELGFVVTLPSNAQVFASLRAGLGDPENPLS